jgi:glycosyltransferase involved in cell wall biosynthesis
VAAATNGFPSLRLGYLVSQYPTASHTFILREITSLRLAGFDIYTLSIRNPDRPLDAMSAEEAGEARRTQAIMALSKMRILSILFFELLRRPAALCKGFGTGLRASRGAPVSVLLYLAYFVEAVVAGHLFLRAGVDHFHSHFASSVGWIITRMFPLTMSVTLHGSAEFIEPETFHLREKIEASRFVVGISHFGVSQMMLATSYREWRKIELVRLGVDVAVYRVERTLRRDGVFRIVTVGRLAEAKGLPLLLEAVAQLIDRGIRLHLDIVGDGPLRPVIAQRAAELGIAAALTMHGMQPADRVRDFYRQADVCVLASFLEGIPVVLMEAMALGTPTIATRVTGCPELIESGTNGLLCTPGDVASLTEALERLAHDPQLRERFSLAGRATIQERYNLATNVEALANIFRKRLTGFSSFPSPSILEGQYDPEFRRA